MVKFAPSALGGQVDLNLPINDGTDEGAYAQGPSANDLGAVKRLNCRDRATPGKRGVVVRVESPIDAYLWTPGMKEPTPGMKEPGVVEVVLAGELITVLHQYEGAKGEDALVVFWHDARMKVAGAKELGGRTKWVKKSDQQASGVATENSALGSSGLTSGEKALTGPKYTAPSVKSPMGSSKTTASSKATRASTSTTPATKASPGTIKGVPEKIHGGVAAQLSPPPPLTQALSVTNPIIFEDEIHPNRAGIDVPVAAGSLLVSSWSLLGDQPESFEIIETGESITLLCMYNGAGGGAVVFSHGGKLKTASRDEVEKGVVLSAMARRQMLLPSALPGRLLPSVQRPSNSNSVLADKSTMRQHATAPPVSASPAAAPSSKPLLGVVDLKSLPRAQAQPSLTSANAVAHIPQETSRKRSRDGEDDTSSNGTAKRARTAAVPAPPQQSFEQLFQVRPQSQPSRPSLEPAKDDRVEELRRGLGGPKRQGRPKKTVSGAKAPKRSSALETILANVEARLEHNEETEAEAAQTKPPSLTLQEALALRSELHRAHKAFRAELAIQTGSEYPQQLLGSRVDKYDPVIGFKPGCEGLGEQTLQQATKGDWRGQTARLTAAEEKAIRLSMMEVAHMQDLL